METRHNKYQIFTKEIGVSVKERKRLKQRLRPDDIDDYDSFLQDSKILSQ